MKKIVCYIREKSNLLVAIPINMLLATVGLIPFLAAAQSSPAYTIQGAVRTTTDAPVVGATIVLEGTQFGTTSDVTGTFTLDLKQKPSQGSALSVSCIGYKTKRIPLTESNAAISVVLEEDNNLLDEVVVIGYGSVQKKDLTGSLSSIDGGAILNRQTQTVSMALQGAMPGVTVTRTNSAPGQSATIRIRGITSMTEGASDPYVLIDGVPGNLSDLNLTDVANITVLKDAASASIYGSQAAAGVILVTTKRGGNSGTSVTYNYTLGLDFPTSMPDYMNAVDYMKAVNELNYNDFPGGGWYQTYTKDVVDNYWNLNREDPDKYPNTDWLSLLLKDYAVRQSHNVSFRSGSAKRSTSLNFGYDDVDGLFTKNLSWKRYTLRLNNDFELFKWMKASADISLRKTDKVNPHTSPSAQMRYIPAIYAATLSDGRYAEVKEGSNKYAALMDGGTIDVHGYKMTGKFQLDLTPFKGFSVTGVFAPNFSYTKEKDFQKQVPYFRAGDSSTVSTKYITEATTTELKETRSDTFSHTTQFYANYQKTFGEDHNFSAMIGYENYKYEQEGLLASKSKFPHSLIPYLSAGGTSDVVAKSENVFELARRSYFGRVMYNYRNKYYIQGNIRRDGSSRFAPDSRWGTFLSASAGWVFTSENFISGTKDWFDFGKLRVSYGELGNERINGYYPYQTTLTPAYSVGYIGNTVTSLPGYSQTAAVVRDLTWETTTTYDVGVDLTFLKNRLSLTADYYYKRTDDMLLTVPIAPIIGLSDPYDNVGTMNTRGWEITLGWRDRIGDLTYSVSFNLSDDVSKMGYIGNKEIISGGKIIREGVEYQSWYGYVSDGIYQTEAEVNDSPRTNSAVTVGDIRYKNIADGADSPNVINAAYDRVVLGSSLPHFNYGGNISLAWKGLDFSMDFQGVGKRNSYLSESMVQPLRAQWYNVPTLIAGANSWSRKNTIEENRHARYPRYSYQSEGNNYAISDFWMFDGSYFRVKNLTLGYSLPERWMNKVWVRNLRFSVTLTDFFTCSDFPKGWDPEGGVSAYPITKSVLFSAQITF